MRLVGAASSPEQGGSLTAPSIGASGPRAAPPPPSNSQANQQMPGLSHSQQLQLLGGNRNLGNLDSGMPGISGLDGGLLPYNLSPHGFAAGLDPQASAMNGGSLYDLASLPSGLNNAGMPDNGFASGYSAAPNSAVQQQQPLPNGLQNGSLGGLSAGDFAALGLNGLGPQGLSNSALNNALAAKLNGLSNGGLPNGLSNGAYPNLGLPNGLSSGAACSPMACLPFHLSLSRRASLIMNIFIIVGASALGRMGKHNLVLHACRSGKWGPEQQCALRQWGPAP